MAISDYLPKSTCRRPRPACREAQPLVLLEAGAAGIPCVTTDVGSCREILEGRSDEVPQLGAGRGICTDLVAPEKIAQAVVELLQDEDKRLAYGDNLRKRVETYYVTELAAGAYGDLYAKYCQLEQAPDEGMGN